MELIQQVKTLIKPTKYLKMRLTVFLLICSLFRINASTYAQNTKLTLNLNNVSLEKVFEEIENKTEFTIFYRDSQVDLSKMISIHVKQQKVDKILNHILKGSNVSFKIIDRHIVLLDKKEPLRKKKVFEATDPALKVPPQFSLMGTIQDKDGQPLPGASILEKGTTNGTQSDFDGNFSIELSNANATLVVSYIGYGTKEISVNGKNSIAVVLEEDAAGLDEVVVTALGIKRDEKSLGYSVTQVEGDGVRESNESNIINALSGRVAGVQINNSSSGVDGSSSIIIRGQSSLGGNNQPLFVIDGIQIDNNQTNINNSGIDYGNGISDLNPDDIESMSVLKGPNAAALYGSRAANGVIVITTKKGRRGVGNVQITSSTVFENPYNILPYQNEYGSGEGPRFTDGFFPTQVIDGVEYPQLRIAWNNFGPKLDGTTVVGFNGELRPYAPQPNNLLDPYQTGIALTNNVSFSGANEDGTSTYRLSLTKRDKTGIIPKNKSDKYTINFRGTTQFTPNLSADVSVSYTSSRVENRIGLGNTRYIYRYVGFFPRDMPHEVYRDFYKNDDGSRNRANPWNYTRHYWFLNENSNFDETKRLIGGVELKYDFYDWLSLQLNGSTDNERRFFDTREGGELAGGVGGSYRVRNTAKEQTTFSFLLQANRSISKDIDLSFNIGGSKWNDKLRSNSIRTDGDLKTPNFFAISNSSLPPISTNVLREKEINSLYGFGQVAYKNLFFVDFTGRNDWSSTLPSDNNSYFYPSVSSSLIFSQALNMDQGILSFGKIRGSWARVGNDTDPYQLQATYNESLTFDGNGAWASPVNVPASNLRPEETSSIEFGADLRFFKNRLGIDFNWYKSSTKNQILSTPIASSSGGSTALINAGEIENKGIEILLNATPIKTKNFSWDFSFNYNRNRNKVIELADGVETLLLAQNGDGPVSVEARPGNPYGDIVTWIPETDPNTGQLIIGSNGRIFRNFERKVVGNIQPDWTGGITNTFTYKNFTLSSLVDISMGGDLYSYTKRWFVSRGAAKESLFGRDAEHGGLAWTDAQGRSRNDGMIVEGVLRDGTPNNIIVDPREFYNQSYQFNWPRHIEDASYVALRELSLSYKLPSKVAEVLKINSASLTLIGRNLWLIYSGSDYLNPLATSYGTGNGAKGLEATALAPARSYGINLRISL